VRFFDASALVKRYIRERGSASIRRLLDKGRVAVARLSEVEVVSAFARLSREGSITAAQRDRVVTAFVADLSAWTIVEITPDVARTARQLLIRYALRSGDAVQLASALMLSESIGPLEAFVAHDARLTAVALAEGMTVSQ
jgi:predicted nucleic acid-binding protein